MNLILWNFPIENGQWNFTEISLKISEMKKLWWFLVKFHLYFCEIQWQKLGHWNAQWSYANLTTLLKKIIEISVK